MWSVYAESGSEVAEGGVEGREDHRERMEGVREDVAERRAGEGVHVPVVDGWSGGGGGGSDEEGVGEDGRDEDGEEDEGSFESLLGNRRCWIQYEVPPTMIGTCFLLCVSSIYATYTSRSVARPSTQEKETYILLSSHPSPTRPPHTVPQAA